MKFFYLQLPFYILRTLRNLIKNRSNHPRHQSPDLQVVDIRSLHCIRFSTGGLPIRKNRPIEARETAVDNRLARDVKNLLLVHF